MARYNTINPISDFLNGLMWDPEKRIDVLFYSYFSADVDDHFPYLVGEKFMISAVARALDPGCKVDTMPVLEGAQGTGKSEALRCLAGDEYFGDALPDLHSKDANYYVRGKWIIEMAELQNLRKSEVETTKAFVSRRVEKFRKAYGRNEIQYPRRCVLAGTTNASDYFQDATGNRRFWPIKCGWIDLELLQEYRDQLPHTLRVTF